MIKGKKVKLLSTITSHDPRIGVESRITNPGMWQIDRGKEGTVREETANDIKVEFYDNGGFKNLYGVNAIYV
jgi:hypothetical protein